MKRFVAALGGSVVLSFAGAAWAQNGGAQDAAFDDGVYVRVAVGASFVSDWEQEFTFNPNLVFAGGAPNGQNLNIREGLTLGGALGFDYADGIRTELEYRYASTDIETITTLGGAAPGAAISSEDVSAHLVMANFYFDFTNKSAWTPFIGGGVGGAFVTNENGDGDAALAYQGRAGVSYDLGGGVAMSVEYIYTRSRDLVFGPSDDEFAASDPGMVRIDGDNYVASSAMVSIRKRF